MVQLTNVQYVLMYDEPGLTYYKNLFHKVVLTTQYGKFSEIDRLTSKLKPGNSSSKSDTNWTSIWWLPVEFHWSWVGPVVDIFQFPQNLIIPSWGLAFIWANSLISMKSWTQYFPFFKPRRPASKCRKWKVICKKLLKVKKSKQQISDVVVESVVRE